MLFLSNRKRSRLNLSSQAKILSIVRNRSLKTASLGFLAVPLVGRYIGLHPKIEDFLPVFPAIISAIQAHGRIIEVYPDSPCYLH